MIKRKMIIVVVLLVGLGTRVCYGGEGDIWLSISSEAKGLYAMAFRKGYVLGLQLKTGREEQLKLVESIDCDQLADGVSLLYSDPMNKGLILDHAFLMAILQIKGVDQKVIDGLLESLRADAVN